MHKKSENIKYSFTFLSYVNVEVQLLHSCFFIRQSVICDYKEECHKNQSTHFFTWKICSNAQDYVWGKQKLDFATASNIVTQEKFSL